MAKDILCAFSIHCDAVAGWLGSYMGEDSPGDISRGVFAAEVGMPRILRLFERFGLTQSWFIPGHTIDPSPPRPTWWRRPGTRSACMATATRIPSPSPATQEEAIFDKSIGLIEKHWGRRPVGYVAPWWEVSATSIEILVERGITYDHSLMHTDCTPLLRAHRRCLDADRLHPAGRELMKPFTKGQETALVDIPASWYLDDLPPMMFIKKSPNSHGYASPHQIEQIWRDHFDFIYREYDYAVVPMTIHPDVSGRPQVLMMLEPLIGHMLKHPGVRFVTLEEMAADYRRRSPRQPG